MTYIKTHLEDFKSDLKKQYTIRMSIKKVEENKLNDLVVDLDQIGVHTTVCDAISVPWFPKEMADMDLLGKDLLQVTD